MDVVERVESEVRRCLLPLGGGPPGVVVALSGGPDSVALARALLGVRPGPDAPLVLAHLNHRLRGAESDSDEQFVTSLHTDLVAQGVGGVELVCERIDVAGRAVGQGANLESSARALRYEWLAGVARSRGLRWVATGHTADDQAETVLHHLLRGTGLDGLRGIAARRGLGPGVEVVRPLLRVTRAEVLAYLEALGQSARQDSSNSDLRYTRNRIRHELLPRLAAEYNPRVASALARLAEQAEEVCRAEELSAQELLGAAELPRAGPLVVLDAPRLAGAPPRLVRGALRLVWAREGWPMGEMGHEEWERLADLASAPEGALDLPGPVHARRRGRVLQLGRKTPA